MSIRTAPGGAPRVEDVVPARASRPGTPASSAAGAFAQVLLEARRPGAAPDDQAPRPRALARPLPAWAGEQGRRPVEGRDARPAARSDRAVPDARPDDADRPRPRTAPASRAGAREAAAPGRRGTGADQAGRADAPDRTGLAGRPDDAGRTARAARHDGGGTPDADRPGDHDAAGTTVGDPAAVPAGTSGPAADGAPVAGQPGGVPATTTTADPSTATLAAAGAGAAVAGAAGAVGTTSVAPTAQPATAATAASAASAASGAPAVAPAAAGATGAAVDGSADLGAATGTTRPAGLVDPAATTGTTGTAGPGVDGASRAGGSAETPTTAPTGTTGAGPASATPPATATATPPATATEAPTATPTAVATTGPVLPVPALQAPSGTTDATAAGAQGQATAVAGPTGAAALAGAAGAQAGGAGSDGGAHDGGAHDGGRPAPAQPAGAPAPTTGLGAVTAPTTAAVGTSAPAAAPAVSVGPFTFAQLAAAAATTRARVAATAMGEITRLVVHMSPEDLGPVRVTAEQTASGVQVDLAGGDETVREALRGALDELRQQLDAGTSGRQDPRDHGRWAPPGGHGGRGQHPGARPVPQTPAVPLPAARPAAVHVLPGRSHRGVDVRA